jgi:hypothetical protein
MAQRTITVEQLREKMFGRTVEELRIITGCEAMSALDILAMEGLSCDDRLEMVMDTRIVNEDTLHEHACICGDSALHYARDEDVETLKNAIATKRRWVCGDVTKVELDAAAEAVYAINVVATQRDINSDERFAVDVINAAVAITDGPRAAYWASNYAHIVGFKRDKQIAIMSELIKREEG